LKDIAAKLFLLLRSKGNWRHSAPVALLSAESSATHHCGLSPGFRVCKTFFMHRSVVGICRERGEIQVSLHDSFLKSGTFQSLFPRLLVVLQSYSLGLSKMLDHSERTTGCSCLHLDLGDRGSTHGRALRTDTNFYAFSRKTEEPEIGLIPDPYNLSDLSNDTCYENYRDKEEARAAYQQRMALIFWRGSTTGRTPRGRIHENRRIRFCIDALEYADSVDAKITNVVQFWNNKTAFQTLMKKGIMAPRVPETAFSNYKATVDLDGNSASWGALRKYLRLIHVIKPRSQFEMFYSVGQPEETFTSIAELEDLFVRLRQNAKLADNFEIAWQGYRFALEARRKIAAGEATIFPC